MKVLLALFALSSSFAFSFSPREAEERTAIRSVLTEYVSADMRGSRAGFQRVPHWSLFVADPEAVNEAWDTVQVVIGAKVELLSVAPDLLSARAKITYQQVGELSSDGTYRDLRSPGKGGAGPLEAHPLVIEVDVVYENQKWLLKTLPDTLPQVSKVSLVKHYQFLLANSQDQSTRSYSELALKALNPDKKTKK